VLREDFPVVLAIVTLISIAFLVLNLVVDIVYTIIDPRVHR
jgi:peptide/nickel transport system permease protein